MQNSELTKTTVDLGRSKLEIHQIKRHAKFAPPSGFCRAGCGWVTLTENMTCPVCKKPLSKTKKKVVLLDAIEKFELFIKENEAITKGDYTKIKIPIEWGNKIHFIPVEEFIRFAQIKFSSEPGDPYREFFEGIKGSTHVELYLSH